ncbi:MAG: NAD(P)H-hydrate epimerase [bacterium]|nr:NAD(P)H-hydrate epimerase [bacterium]
MDPVALTRDQVRRVDALAIDELGIPGVVLMENAGRNAAERIRLHLTRGDIGRVVVLCGAGNNGGDGFVIARHLANWGIEPVIYLAGSAEGLSPDSHVNHQILRNMGLQVSELREAAEMASAMAGLEAGDVVIDALLGTGFSGQVRAPLDTLIETLNTASKHLVVAIDVPSGLDCDTGSVGSVAVRADLTITFVAPKVGFAVPAARKYVGAVAVCDIGAPPSLIDRVKS